MKKKIIIIVIFIIIFSVALWLCSHNEKQVSETNVVVPEIRTDDKIPEDLRDEGIFTKYYNDAYEKLQTMTLEEKIGQIFLVRYDPKNVTSNIQNYNFGGYIFFAKDFEGKTKEQVQSMIAEAQQASKIPLITAVDEEGGTVVRVSSNKSLSESKFKSPMELYKAGGLEQIKQDTIEKSRLLYGLGINLNLAPVVDISSSTKDYMYNRTLGEGKEKTAEYAKTVIEASKGTGVSYTLKHFPGYGSNLDTHKKTSVEKRSYEEIMENDIVPFKAGIEGGAEAVLVSHNIVNSIDNENPASLSSKIHKLLRDNLGFTGVIITDDLDMAAAKIDNAVTKAITAGNDFIIITDYDNSIKEVKSAINNGTLNEEIIDKMAFRVLAWKYYKGLISNESSIDDTITNEISTNTIK